MKRGDVVLVTYRGDYGKPRPSIVMQSDHLGSDHASIVVALCTTHHRDAPLFRITIERSDENGLDEDSQVMADKLVAVPKENVKARVGQISEEQMLTLDRAVALVLGLADRSN